MNSSLLRALAYEAKPFICLILGLYAFSLRQGLLSHIPGMTLTGCAIAILYMRGRYRGIISK